MSREALIERWSLVLAGAMVGAEGLAMIQKYVLHLF